MTYLDAHTQFDFTSADEHGTQEIDTAIIPGFSGLEWSVIALAQRDRVDSLREPGRIATALAAFSDRRAPTGSPMVGWRPYVGSQSGPGIMATRCPRPSCVNSSLSAFPAHNTKYCKPALPVAARPAGHRAHEHDQPG